MTEDEAKTKWCPFVRLVFLSQADPATYVGNRFEWTDLELGDELDGQRMSGLCIGSECMAWRWTNSPERIKEHELLNKKGVGQPGRENKPWPEGQPAGYCGLAGKP